jgi:hypothetical protein
MYLIVIGWMYVVLMMSVAEATNTTGTVLGALVTFVLYGVGPAALVVYLMGAPARSKAIKKRHAEEVRMAASASPEPSRIDEVPVQPWDASGAGHPDAGRHAPGRGEAVAADAGVTPVRKEP